LEKVVYLCDRRMRTILMHNEAKNKWEETALLLAASRGHSDVVKELLDANATTDLDINTHSENSSITNFSVTFGKRLLASLANVLNIGGWVCFSTGSTRDTCGCA
jgi:ankyrin repeat protein